ncbi:MAG: ImmA/IrrE family metallo-endopeptidase [Acidimicrobiales bacterium]
MGQPVRLKEDHHGIPADHSGQRAERIDAAHAAHAALTAGVESIASSDDWRKYLDFQRKFTKYSAGNTVLLMQQSMLRGVEPDGFAGYGTWQAVGRWAKRGEGGFTVLVPVVRSSGRLPTGIQLSWPQIPVWRPQSPGRRLVRGFTTATVLELSQTEGEPYYPSRSGPSASKGKAPKAPGPGCHVSLVGRLHGRVTGVDALGATCNGRTNFTDKTVVVRDDLEPAQQVKTLAHELAHIKLGHERVAAGFDHRDVAEIEAESVSYLVCTELGMDPADYSFGYVASWIQEMLSRCKR